MLVTKKSTFKEFEEFCQENGYLIALYTRTNDTDNWKLENEMIDYLDIFSPDTVIVCPASDENSINFKMAETEDRRNAFYLHNNFKIPKVIPFFNRN